MSEIDYKAVQIDVIEFTEDDVIVTSVIPCGDPGQGFTCDKFN